MILQEEKKKKRGKQKARRLGRAWPRCSWGQKAHLARALCPSLELQRRAAGLLLLRSRLGGRAGGCRSLGKATPAFAGQELCPSCCLAPAMLPARPAPRSSLHQCCRTPSLGDLAAPHLSVAFPWEGKKWGCVEICAMFGPHQHPAWLQGFGPLAWEPAGAGGWKGGWVRQGAGAACGEGKHESQMRFGPFMHPVKGS